MTPYSDAVTAAGGDVLKAAKAMGKRSDNFRRGLAAETARLTATKEEAVTFPTFPSADVPIGDLVVRLAREQRAKTARAKAEKWFRIHLHEDAPIGVLNFGDPHLGVSSKWDRLHRDMMHVVTEPGLYGANLGDLTNNWVGRLLRIAADESIAQHEEKRLARWFLYEAGIPWLWHILGNHDEWNGGPELYRHMNVHNKVPVLNWEAKFELIFPGKQKIRVHAAHDFPGNSMWNITHGPTRAAKFGSADLYLCGHKHDWGISQFETTETGRSPIAIRCRGYKENDPYAKRHGFQQAEHGASILTIFDPHAEGPGRVLAFADIDQGVRVLRALRSGKISNAKASTRKAASGRAVRPNGRGKNNRR